MSRLPNWSTCNRSIIGIRRSRTKAALTLPAGFEKRLLHGRKQVVEYRARTEICFTCDLRARLQHVALSVGQQLLTGKLYQRTKRQRAHRTVAARKRIRSR